LLVALSTSAKAQAIGTAIIQGFVRDTAGTLIPGLVAIGAQRRLVRGRDDRSV
jgi:hypothetical protein